VLGLAVLTLCGWNSYNIVTKQEHHLALELFNGDSFRLQADNAATIAAIDEALQKARNSR